MRASGGLIDPVIGRKEEIERVVQIICRRTKNNPILLGEAGVGKTAIAEGLALKIAEGDVPIFLVVRSSDGYPASQSCCKVLPPFQIIRHSKNLEESKHLKFDQNYRENYKNL
jgi:DNA helicase TIP49 (TBP-interacting protein)